MSTENPVKMQLLVFTVCSIQHKLYISSTCNILNLFTAKLIKPADFSPLYTRPSTRRTLLTIYEGQPGHNFFASISERTGAFVSRNFAHNL